MIEKLGMKVLRQLDPERAHHAALMALRAGLAPLPGPLQSKRLRTDLAGLKLPNPVGLAAGFDKNAVAVSQLCRAGFGFVELGAVTPKPQPGNPKPRLFRLTADRAVINRFGFNNDGAAAIARRLSGREFAVPVGVNLGANKDSAERADDFARVLATIGPHVDFATVNVSSPNTEKLRDLQGAAALTALLKGVLATRDTLSKRIPIFLKIAPDLTDAEIADIAGVATDLNLDGIIATNTTLARDGLTSKHRDQKGGLSGAPLFEKSTRVLARLSRETGGQIPLIGVGGISNAAQAYAKIKAGASAVQLYTAMVYHGLSIGAEVARGLDELATADGLKNMAEAVGQETGKWL